MLSSSLAGRMRRPLSRSGGRRPKKATFHPISCHDAQPVPSTLRLSRLVGRLQWVVLIPRHASTTCSPTTPWLERRFHGALCCRVLFLEMAVVYLQNARYLSGGQTWTDTYRGVHARCQRLRRTGDPILTAGDAGRENQFVPRQILTRTQNFGSDDGET
jgi:hypothetical protein